MNDNVKIFAKTIEDEAIEQISVMSEHEVGRNSKIRIMPDAHAGAGCTIGTTMTLENPLMVCPNLVGVDIGCGMLALKLDTKMIDFNDLEAAIRWSIPVGKNIRTSETTFFDLSGLKFDKANTVKAQLSLGTLGGGNHFIEVDRDKKGYLWLLIHSGSRHLGLEVANHYQELAYNALNKYDHSVVYQIIEKLKAEGRQKQIGKALEEYKKSSRYLGPKDLAYLTGDNALDYLHDMAIVQSFAQANREEIARQLVKVLHLTVTETVSTVHNYIDLDSMILRKGAVSAKQGEKLVIPINMRDGTLICVGKGNEDWNFSAPHGAGRLMSRTQAKAQIPMHEFVSSMNGIFTKCVSFDTLDEAPAAYKDMDEIIECIKPTCKIIDIIKPVYNLKASS